jgi:hypothetical protein
MRGKRYQDCGILEKVWRRRYYLWIPIDAISWFFNSSNSLSFAEKWSIAIGSAQIKMNWVYDWEDIKREIYGEYEDANERIESGETF